ncbi:beta-lactamase domain protein [Alkaliphilus metalliredigens QYMF]|uniref:Beta-lactamase domain protein n=1 Tax=Alkaliphilus metalliredigens (strain QYMF) TaxID=293826 RepID=A6TST8_ALKMQ|nr:beta-lactamase domain protein [Alkaliphilus metalliredigens QYMF]
MKNTHQVVKGEICVNLIIHRGAKQIGGSCTEVFTERTRIILDIGQELPNIDDEKLKKPSSFPRVKGLYREDDKKIDAILISHGHGDHIGLLEYVDTDIPIFIGEKALEIFNVTAQFTGGKSIANPVNYFKSGQEMTIGDFSITPYLVDHSGFDAYGFVIKADGKCIVYTGDFRDHGRKKKATDCFRSNIPKGVDALLIEGTMMSRISEKIETEEQIEQKAFEFMSSPNRPVFVLQSSTNIDRLVGMYRAAQISGRIFVMDIFTAHIVSQLNNTIPKPGKFKDVRVFYPYHLTKRMFEELKEEKLMKQFNRNWISREELGKRSDYCMLIRNTMLSDLEHIKNLQGAGFIFSMWRGYKKQRRTDRLLDYAKNNNMDIIDLHTSGHAHIDSLKKVIRSSGAKKIIPIHTERSDLFAEAFEKVYLAEDGETILI